jgi:hypothetical protein
MSAFSVATALETPAPAGGDGVKIVTGTLTGTSSYDTNGSTLDLSSYFNATNGSIDQVLVYSDSGNYHFSTDVAAVATSKVKAFGISYVDVTYDYTNALFDATATSDTTTWAQPANTTLLGARLTLGTKFAGPSLSSMIVILGDGVDADGFMAGTANLFSATVGVQTTTLGALFVTGDSFHTTAALNRTLTATSVGCNMDDLTAGEITVRFYYAPGSANVIGTSNSELISTFDLSGETIRFIAVGRDA